MLGAPQGSGISTDHVTTYSPILIHFTVDGGWSDWKDWERTSKCTVLCGGGKMNQARDRRCTNPVPQYGGADCTGESRQKQIIDCNVKDCGGKWPVDYTTEFSVIRERESHTLTL